MISDGTGEWSFTTECTEDLIAALQGPQCRVDTRILHVFELITQAKSSENPW